ncbi:MAG: SDR family oxidoreductase [Parcubacteria group bacterium]|nr:SDR family oxidoreductase [Parcubacteria group bacterium]
MYSLTGKNVIITGAGNRKSIGYAVASALLESEVNKIFLLDVKQKIFSNGKMVCYQHDVRDVERVMKLHDYIERRYGHIDVLVNGAGILDTGKDVHDYQSEDTAAMKHVMDVNFYGAINWYLAVIPGMIERNDGCVINVASIAGLNGRPHHAAYAASKAALVSFTRSCSWEAASKAPNVRVNAVAPGFVETEMTDTIPKEARDAVLQNEVPSHEAVKPQEVAEAILSLIQNTGKNGAVDVVDKRRK